MLNRNSQNDQAAEAERIAALMPEDDLRAPQENGASLIVPAIEDVPELVRENRRLAEEFDYDLQGKRLSEVAALARRELIAGARRWTSAYREVPSRVPAADSSIFLAGHQPQMFHPGVWFKNFALGAIAAHHRATAINLIIDDDVFASASLRVPGGSLAAPRVLPIAMDRPEPKVAYEERKIEDRVMFASFGRRIAEQIRPLVANPLIEEFWPMVRRRADETDNLGACIAQGRHQLEATWGLHTLEVPQSEVCRGEAFQWFIAHLLARLADFREVYNTAIREYRRLHRIRSTSHPAPELAQEGDWLEAPLWVWTVENSRRRRLFVRRRAEELIVSDRQAWEAVLPLSEERDGAPAVARLFELQHNNVRIRPRALITTLWARLVLGDLFIHGIGGAKYDRVTDVLMERFFGRRAPGLMVVTATLLLPVEHADSAAEEQRTIAAELRGLAFHPERFLDGVQKRPASLIAEKRRWIKTAQTRENARQRCRTIRSVNEALQPWLEDRRKRLEERQSQLAQRIEAERVLGSREYAFVLYPEDALRRFLAVRSG